MPEANEADANPRAVVGGNSPPPYDVIKDRTELLKKTANLWLTERGEIKTEEEANKARDFLEQVAKESAAAEKERVEETAPHLKAQRDIMAKYRALIDPLDLIKKALSPLMDKWADKLEAERKRKLAEAQETARKAEEVAAQKRKEAEAAAEAARLDAERRRLEAEEAKTAATAAKQEAGAAFGDIIGSAAASMRADEEAAEAKKALKVAEKAKVQITGNHSTRAMSQRTRKIAKVTDHAAALAHYATRPTILEEVRRLAQFDSDHAKGETLVIPGVVFEEERKVV